MYSIAGLHNNEAGQRIVYTMVVVSVSKQMRHTLFAQRPHLNAISRTLSLLLCLPVSPDY